jgi:hypothetical protein
VRRWGWRARELRRLLLVGVGVLTLAVPVAVLAVLLLGSPMRGTDDHVCVRRAERMHSDPLLCDGPPELRPTWEDAAPPP